MKLPSINKRWELVGQSSSFITSQWYNHETCLIASQMVANVFGANLLTEVNCLSAHTSLASPSCLPGEQDFLVLLLLKSHTSLCLKLYLCIFFFLVVCCFLSLSAFRKLQIKTKWMLIFRVLCFKIDNVKLHSRKIKSACTPTIWPLLSSKKKKKKMKNKLKACPNFSVLCDKDNPWLPDKCGVLLKVHYAVNESRSWNFNELLKKPKSKTGELLPSGF